jgi:hypothetical protein
MVFHVSVFLKEGCYMQGSNESRVHGAKVEVINSMIFDRHHGLTNR